MLARVLLGYLIALPVFVPLLARSTGEPGYVLSVTMSSTPGGVLQVFFDTGTGYSERQSVRIPVGRFESPREYKVPMPPGRYRSIRIDPGMDPGLYVIQNTAVLEGDGSIQTTIPLSAVRPLHQLRIVNESPHRLVLESPPGSNDPVLVYSPDEMLVLPPHERTSAWLLGRLALFCACGTVVAFVVGGLLRPGTAVYRRAIDAFSEFAERRPRSVLFIIALAMTTLATYPLLLLNRSLVTPNNHGLPMLYDEAPFVPASTDIVIENTRGSDVAATMWQEVPHSHVQREALAHREIPLWNRYNATGRPLWGQGLTHFLDPLHWITLLAPDPALGWDLKFVAHRLLFSFGVGLAGFAITGAWLPSGVMAAAAPFAGVFLFRLNHPAIFSLTYAPWVLLAWFGLASATASRARAHAATILALASALLLVGSTPKEAFVTLLSTHGVGALAVLLSPGSGESRRLRWVSAAWAGAAFLLLTTPHWMVFFQTLKTSVTVYDQAYVDLAELRHVAGLFLGGVMPGNAAPGLHLLGLVTTVAGFMSLDRSDQRHAAVACALGIVTVAAVAFGALPASWLLRIPLVAQIGHVHETLLTAVTPLLLIFGALGVQTLLTASARRVLGVTVATGLAAGCLLAVVRETAWDDRFDRWAVGLMMSIAIIFPVSLFSVRRAPHSLLAMAVLALSGLILLLPGGLHARSGIEPLDRLLIQPRPRVRLDTASPAVMAVHRAATTPARTVGVEGVLFPGSQALYELESIGGADPLEQHIYRELQDTAGVPRLGYWITVVPPGDFTRLSGVLDLLNVGFVLAPHQKVPPGLVEVAANEPDRLRALRRPTAWPRAFFVDGATTYAGVAEFLKLVGDRGRPFAAIDLEDTRAADATRKLPPPTGLVIPATDYVLTANSTRFRVRSDRAGVVVLGEMFVPDDFRATVNGNAVEYFRVDHIFKAITIPGAGDWEIRFEYRPAHWTEVWLTAAAGWLLLVAMWLVPENRYRVDARSSEYPAARASS